VELCGVYKRFMLADGREVISRTLLVATGMIYRELDAPGGGEFTGAGGYYGAATTEAPAFSGKCVLVVGGGNSAGQGAMHLARYAKEVQIVVRRDSLRDTRSHSLVHQIEQTPNIRLRPHMAIARVEGDGHVERAVLTSLDDDTSQVVDAEALFVFICSRQRNDLRAHVGT